MLGAELGNLKTQVRSIYDILRHSVDFVSKDKRITAVRLRIEFLKLDSFFCLFHTDYGISLILKAFNELHSIIAMLPRHSILGT